MVCIWAARPVRRGGWQFMVMLTCSSEDKLIFFNVKRHKSLYEAKRQSCFSPFSQLMKYSSTLHPAWLELPVIRPSGID